MAYVKKPLTEDNRRSVRPTFHVSADFPGSSSDDPMCPAGENEHHLHSISECKTKERAIEKERCKKGGQISNLGHPLENQIKSTTQWSYNTSRKKASECVSIPERQINRTHWRVKTALIRCGFSTSFQIKIQDDCCVHLSRGHQLAAVVGSFDLGGVFPLCEQESATVLKQFSRVDIPTEEHLKNNNLKNE